nr:transposase [Mesorhizobium composti]
MSEVLRCIAELYRVEDDICGQSADERCAVRQERNRPIVAQLEPWLLEKPGLISQKTKLAEVIRYTLSLWEELSRFLDDGCIELDSNSDARSTRPVASRKHSDVGRHVVLWYRCNPYFERIV